MTLVSLVLMHAVAYFIAGVLVVGGVLLIGLGVLQLRRLAAPEPPEYSPALADGHADDGLELPTDFDDQQQWASGLVGDDGTRTRRLPNPAGNDRERLHAYGLIGVGVLLLIAGTVLFLTSLLS